MKKLLIPVFILLIVASCATIKVTSDFDKTAKFPGYKTYAFTPEAQKMTVDDLNKKRILNGNTSIHDE